MNEPRNEMALLQALGESLDPGDGGPSPEVRDRALATIRRPSRRSRLIRLPASRVGPQTAWRPALAVAATAAAVVAVFGAATLLPDDLGRPPVTSAPPAAPGARTEAATALHNAAEAAIREPAAVPRANQFIFTESQVVEAWYAVAVDGVVEKRSAEVKRFNRQIWLSAPWLHHHLADRPRRDVALPEHGRRWAEALARGIPDCPRASRVPEIATDR